MYMSNSNSISCNIDLSKYHLRVVLITNLNPITLAYKILSILKMQIHWQSILIIIKLEIHNHRETMQEYSMVYLLEDFHSKVRIEIITLLKPLNRLII